MATRGSRVYASRMLSLILAGGIAVLFFQLRRERLRINGLEDQVAALLRRLSALEWKDAPLQREPARQEAAVEQVAPASPNVGAPPSLGISARDTDAPVEAIPPQREPEQALEEAEPAPSMQDVLANVFERFVGGRLLIWIGGVALAVAGIFLIRYSIEIGLVTPLVRMVAAAAFGLVLLGAGEAARHRPVFAADPRIAQALIGAGLLILYASVYGSLTLYGLIGLGTASALMLLVTIAALGMSLRHGAPAAVLGLVGGFLTPLLVGDPNSGVIPLLGYLALLNIALFALAQRRGWAWLAAAAALLSFVWTAFLLITPAQTEALAAGLFVLALSVAAALARPGERRALPPVLPVLIGLLQLAALVARVDLGLPAWALFGALSAASLFLAWRSDAFRMLPTLALGIALFLLFAKSTSADSPLMPEVAVGITLLFGGAGLLAAMGLGKPAEAAPKWRWLWTGIACAGLAAPALILHATQPWRLVPAGWGVVMLGLAIGPALLAWRQAEREKEKRSGSLLLASATVLLLTGVAAADLLPDRMVPAVWMALVAGAGLFARKTADRGVARLALAAAMLAALVAAVMVPELWTTSIESLAGMPALAAGLPSITLAFWCLALPGALLILLSKVIAEEAEGARIPLVIGSIFLGCAAYILFKQAFGLRDEADFVARGFAERMLITQALFAAGWAAASGRIRSRWIDERRAVAVGEAMTLIAAARFVLFDLALHNPAFAAQAVGPLPILNLLLPAYLGTAFWLYRARRRALSAGASRLWLLLFLTALCAGLLLLVRQAFHGSVLAGPAMSNAEFYLYSLAGLVASVVLLLTGVRLKDKGLRVAGLAVLTATIVKVFLVDAGALQGLLRILSFLGLGIALIGVGMLYGTILGRPKGAAAGDAAAKE